MSTLMSNERMMMKGRHKSKRKEGLLGAWEEPTDKGVCASKCAHVLVHLLFYGGFIYCALRQPGRGS